MTTKTPAHKITRTWLTPEAADRLRAERDEILSVRLPAIEDALSEAQSSGSLIDNGDLDAALSERALFAARLSQIEDTLASATIKTSTSTIADVAGVGMVVTLQFEDGSEEEFLFADPSNRVPGYVTLSPMAPLGAALLGSPVGALVSYKSPQGSKQVKLLAARPL